MSYVNDDAQKNVVNKQKLEINPKHPVMKKIMEVKVGTFSVLWFAQILRKS